MSRSACPFPHELAQFVGRSGSCGGAQPLLLGFFAGDAALLLLPVIVTALLTTKFPVLFGQPIGPFPLMKLNHYGALSFFHEARTDLAMLFGLVAILVDSGLRVGRRRRWYQSKGL